MFTLIHYFRQQFQGIMSCSFDRFANMRAADDNKDGVLTGGEFNNETDRSKRAVQREMGGVNSKNMQAFREAGRIRYEQKEKAQDGVREEAGKQQNATSRQVEQAPDGTLSPNKLRGAVSFYESGRCSRQNIENLITIMKHRGLQYNGTWESFAQNIATIQVSLGMSGSTVDGKAGSGTIRALNIHTRSAGETGSQTTASQTPARSETTRRGAETAGGFLTWPVTNGSQRAREMQAIVGTPVDGVFGPNSRRQMQRFLRDRGLYNGAIDGDVGSGTTAAMRAFNEAGGGSVPVRGEQPSSGKETTGRSFFQRLGDFIQRGGERPTDMSGIDTHIDATNRELSDLDQAIQEATSTGNTQKINAAHAQAMQLLRGKISPELYNVLTGARSTIEKNRVLDFISNALMGGARTVDIAQGRASAREYASNLEGLRASTREVLASEGVSSDFITHTLAQVGVAQDQIRSASRFTYGRSQAVAAFSVRSKGSNRGLQPFSRGSAEKISVDGISSWEIPENQQDILAFINNMSPAVLRDIDTQIAYNSGQLTKAKLVELLQAGEVDIDIDMIIAHNCGNVSFELRIIDNTQAPEKDNDGGDDGGGDDMGTNPGEDQPGGGAGTAPGEGDDPEPNNDTDGGAQGARGGVSGEVT